VTVVLDGRAVVAYREAYLVEGRVFTALSPLLTGVADRFRWEGDTLVIERGERNVRVRLSGASAAGFDAQYVPAAPVLRALGATVRYDPVSRRLFVTLAQRVVPASPTPFDPALRQVSPAEVFTPSPATTPRPIWTGSPMPRRTALPLPPLHRDATAPKSRSPNPRSETLRSNASIASMTGRRS
jgi:hypothetical protein